LSKNAPIESIRHKYTNIPYSMSTKMRKKKGVEVMKIEDNMLFSAEVHFVENSVRLYFNAQHKLIHLKQLQRSYFDFMCEKMNSRNQIKLAPSFREEFISFCERVLGKESVRSPRTLIEAEDQMKKLNLIFKVPEMSGLWYVNPKHVFKGTETARTKLIERLGVQSSVHPYIRAAILNVPDSELTPPEVLRKLPTSEHEITEPYSD
jgi:hypothetical protein